MCGSDCGCVRYLIFKVQKLCNSRNTRLQVRSRVWGCVCVCVWVWVSACRNIGQRISESTLPSVLLIRVKLVVIVGKVEGQD